MLDEYQLGKVLERDIQMLFSTLVTKVRAKPANPSKEVTYISDSTFSQSSLNADADADPLTEVFNLEWN